MRLYHPRNLIRKKLKSDKNIFLISPIQRNLVVESLNYPYPNPEPKNDHLINCREKRKHQGNQSEEFTGFGII